MKKTTILLTVTALLCASASCGKEGLQSSSMSSASIADTTAVTTAEAETTAIPTTTAKNTESTTAADKTTANTDNSEDYTGLSGYWYIDGDTSTASIHITKDGKFTAYYPNGIVEERGYVKRVLEPTINNYIFYMYRDSGELFQTFSDDGEKEKSDIYMGNDGTPHYVKLYGEGGVGDDGKGPEERFEGSWSCGRAIIEITYKGEGVFHALIKWSGSASSSGLWNYPLIYDNGKLICSGNGTLTHVEFKDAESAPDETIEYTDGSAEFTLEGDRLFWNDLKEHCADDMLFIKD